jgi:IS30 family transposase
MSYTFLRVLSLLPVKRGVMEIDWVCKRAHLRALLQQHADWSLQQLADAVGCSKSTVSRWKKRFAQADPRDGTVLFSRSRAPHHHPPRLAEEVVERIMQMRLSPPENLKRTPSTSLWCEMEALSPLQKPMTFLKS